MKISVVIVSLNGRSRIAMPLDALAKCDPAPSQVIVVDNGSTDGLADFLEDAYPGVMTVRAPANLGFAGGNNLGVVNAAGDVVILLNDDTEPEPGWLAPIIRAFENDSRLGIAGCQLLYPGGQVQHLGAVVHENGLTDHVNWGDSSAADGTEPIPCAYVTGAAMAIRREVFAGIGLLDAGFFPIYFEEVDFCERAARAGFGIAVLPDSRVVHHESQTTGRLSKRFLKMYHRNRVRYLLKNRGLRSGWRTLRAEARWMARHTPWDNLWPCALAYAWAPFHAAELFSQRRRKP